MKKSSVKILRTKIYRSQMRRFLFFQTDESKVNEKLSASFQINNWSEIQMPFWVILNSVDIDFHPEPMYTLPQINKSPDYSIIAKYDNHRRVKSSLGN